MGVFRLSLGLVLFALAGAFVVGNSLLEFGEYSLIGLLASWIGAGYLAWQGVRAFLGKIQPPGAQGQPQAAPQPGPPVPSDGPSAPPGWPGPQDAFRPPSHAFTQENRPPVTRQPSERVESQHIMNVAADIAGDTRRFMRRASVVLALILLVPITLGLLIAAVVMFSGGNPGGAIPLLCGGVLAWYCLGPLAEYWDEAEEPATSGTEGRARGEADRGVPAAAGRVSPDGQPVPSGTQALPTSPPPVLSLPEEFLLLCHLSSGEVHDYSRAAAGCLAAELGELALCRRVRIVPFKKIRIFGFDTYLTPGKIQLLDTAPTGLPWADVLLTELNRQVAAKGGPVSLRTWFRLRGDEAFLLHRGVLVQRVVLRQNDRGEHHYPEAGLRDLLINRLQAVTSERAPMDEHMLLLLDLLGGVGLEEPLGLTWASRQRLDRARGTGAVAAIPEHMRDTGAVLSASMPASRTSGRVGDDDGEGDGGGGE